MVMSPEEEQEIALGRPTKFKPDWPPQSSQAPLPKVFSKCSEKFKKVSWPPKDDEIAPVDMPVSNVVLQDEMQMNEERWKPCGTYKAVPPIYAEQPAQLNEDVWPPPENLDLSERVIHDASRPKRAIRDYTVFFDKNKKPEAGQSYKVPPGTLHVVAERGVLSFDNVDIGRGTLAEGDGKKKTPPPPAKQHPKVGSPPPRGTFAKKSPPGGSVTPPVAPPLPPTGIGMDSIEVSEDEEELEEVEESEEEGSDGSL